MADCWVEGRATRWAAHLAHCWAALCAQSCATPWTERWFKGWIKGWVDERVEGRPVLSPLQLSAAFETMPEWPGPRCTEPAADVKAEGWAILAAVERGAALEAMPAWPGPRCRCVVGMTAKCWAEGITDRWVEG